MAKYELSDVEVNNALVFLKRVQMTGEEAEAFLAVKYALSKPVVEEKEKGKEDSV